MARIHSTVAIREKGLYTGHGLQRSVSRDSDLHNNESTDLGGLAVFHAYTILTLSRYGFTSLFRLSLICGLIAAAYAQGVRASQDTSPAVSNAAPLDLQVNAGYQFDDNVTRAGASPDQLSDQSLNLDLSKRLIFPLNANTRALLSFDLGGEKFRNFDGLSRFTAGVQGEWQYRSSAAFDAPTFALFGRVAAEQFQSALRDGYRYSVGVSVQQALTDRISLFGALSHNGRAADNSVFDNQDNAVRLNLDYQINAANTFYLGAEYRRGDSVTTTSPSSENASIATALVQNDDAYSGRQLTSYRFDGETVLTTLGYNLALNAQSSLDFSWRRIRTTPDLRENLISVPSRYTANQYLLVFLLRF